MLTTVLGLLHHMHALGATVSAQHGFSVPVLLKSATAGCFPFYKAMCT